MNELSKRIYTGVLSVFVNFTGTYPLREDNQLSYLCCQGGCLVARPPLILLFNFAAAITITDRAGEIVLVLVLPRRERDLKGLYRVLKKRKEK